MTALRKLTCLESGVLVFAEVEHLLVGLQHVGHQVEVGQAHALHPTVASNSLRVTKP